MTWYYALGNERQGPIDDAALDRLIATGVVTADTLVLSTSATISAAARLISSYVGRITTSIAHLVQC